MVYVNESALELLLEKAARAHEAHARRTAGIDPDWTRWYASFIVRHLREREEKD